MGFFFVKQPFSRPWDGLHPTKILLFMDSSVTTLSALFVLCMLYNNWAALWPFFNVCKYPIDHILIYTLSMFFLFSCCKKHKTFVSMLYLQFKMYGHTFFFKQMDPELIVLKRCQKFLVNFIKSCIIVWPLQTILTLLKRHLRSSSLT